MRAQDIRYGITVRIFGHAAMAKNHGCTSCIKEHGDKCCIGETRKIAERVHAGLINVVMTCTDSKRGHTCDYYYDEIEGEE